MKELLSLENDEAVRADYDKAATSLEKQLDRLAFNQMFDQPEDKSNAFMTIQSGSGGTEAQDWCEMLVRMYLRWLESRNFSTEIQEITEGDEAGLRSAVIQVKGSFAFGWLRTEAGIHRLVRKSPFDSGNRRHTSFASVFVTPEIDDTIDIEVDMADVRVDTYRASGAGGQHVNKTDSAVRMTHIPSGIVVQCQSQRSQHQNRDSALAQLRSRLYEQELQKRNAAKQSLEATKTDIGWGQQIRSYVLDQARIKDLRTGYESSNTKAVLDGDLDGFVEASLKQGIPT